MRGWWIIVLGAVVMYGGAGINCKLLAGVGALLVLGGVVMSLLERDGKPLFHGLFKTH